MSKTLVCCFVLLAAAHVLRAHAEKADKDKPLNISADLLEMDEKQKTSVFSGNVLVTKGTILLRAERIETQADANNQQHMLATAKPSQRVFFRQKREGYDEFIEGEAKTLTYDEKTDLVTLSGDAVMRRLKGNTLSDESTAQRIVFNNTTEQFKLQGATNPSIPQSGSSDRVRVVLSPKDKDPRSGTGTGTGATPPAASRLKSAPSLRTP